MKSVILLVTILIIGCASRPPGRDACYARADASALAEYVAWCGSYAQTNECPYVLEIEHSHQLAQEACP